ncbi:carboxypeptidase-like regulatory domain-containing protein [Spirosoma endophyticum]|uniref:CarboxypepD_reg-like domain-containing protein n=1 Tax=Spirosoma endophyticum TaxID=662367 RepID=A0A1I1YUF4_9BACT|nr:carboxypeptidase-like regulatory domain-containing protein [Spirosoma endophyticum]SFE21660.1 CarboxypepD_reg-like domain-containing protein [Spirosoma endophyticum]
MKPKESGRFCDSCQKTVVDFTTMTDQQIGAYFSNQPKNVCGRFTAGQLNRDVVLAQNASNSVLKQRWLGLMTAGLLSWSSTQGQSTQLSEQSVLIGKRITPELSAKSEHIDQHETTVAKDSTWVIEGKVIAETDKAPLPGVYIIVKSTQQGTTTDANGTSKLTLPLQDDQFILRVMGIGFVSQEIEINPARKLPLAISLAEDSVALGQVVVTGTVCARKPTFFKRLKNRLRASR